MTPGFKIGDRVRTVGDGITGRVVGFVPDINWPIIYVTHSTRWPEIVGQCVPNDPDKLVRQDWSDA